MSFLHLLLRTDFSLNYSSHFPVYLSNFLCWRSTIVSAALMSAGFCCVPLKSVGSVIGNQVGLRFRLIFPRLSLFHCCCWWGDLVLAFFRTSSVTCALSSFTSRTRKDCLPSMALTIIQLPALWDSFLTSVHCLQCFLSLFSF